ncbi:MAG: TetM/TetW/TetO/TetS family tetracycline resistance ribosomal protection protein [Eubacteriales bacterium]|nr:TetM/TetW/TetO/TetS family tetracycline resistance ribosomal protection protein [Eubacteriales bacterium]
MIKTVAVLAHVDAGKTSFSERVLYLARAIRTLGRVDHQDAFLDSDPLERQRGITIFSGQARFALGEDTIQWLDTPGHTDFTPETERALSATDSAVVLLSAVEGVQSHTETLWQLLAEYRKPVAFFLNKTDRETADPDGALAQLRRMFSADVLDMRSWQAGEMSDELKEALAERDEALMERYFSSGYDEDAWLDALTRLMKERRAFPVFAGSALTGEGVEAFLRCYNRITATDYAAREDAPFRATVYRVRHDEQGAPICFCKVEAGALRVKDELQTPDGAAKVNELRLYHGTQARSVERVAAGELAAIPWLEGVRPGDRLGENAGHGGFHTEPMLAVDVLWDRAALPAFKLLPILRALEAEDPSLCVQQQGDRLSLHVMGPIQLEVLEKILPERYGVRVSFGPCRVLYQETVAAPVVGVGHYEPLRHYAEAHLRLNPAPRGSGVSFRSACHVDSLALNWQRLIETHVFERTHKGVLTGSPLTDVEIVLLSGRAHLKHTEGGDFRQATYRAIRNGLMHGQSVLLEPVCRFRMRVPSELFGRVSGELSRIGATLDAPEYAGDTASLSGLAVYAEFMRFQEGFLALTHGRGACACRMDHYEPCRNTDEVIAQLGYQPLADEPADSVFCAKGAGYNVPWDEVRAHAHLPVEPDEA